MEIVRTRPLYSAGSGGKTYISVHERTFVNKGQERPYYMVARGGSTVVPSAEEKKPDAVVCVGVVRDEDGDQSLVVTSEFRVAIGCREISFPAGIIDESDYRNAQSIQEAVATAARREFKEETGLDFEPTLFSPPNLYSSAGLTNESTSLVFGMATGKVSKEHLEQDEDIDVLILNRKQVGQLLSESKIPFSKIAWPLLWSFYTKWIV